MYKFLPFIAASAAFGFSASLNAAPVTLTFERTGTTASSVTVNVAGIDGVTAEITSTSHNFKSTAQAVTPQIICPDINGNTAPDITMVLTIHGLPADFVFSNAALDIHALNGGSAYQDYNDGKTRQWNVNLSVNGNAFGSLSDIDIASNVNPGGDRHKIWDVTTTATAAATDPLVFTINVTKGTANEGCFFGLSSITLSNPITESSAKELFDAYTADRKKRLEMLGLWNDAETATATGIDLDLDAADLNAELEAKKAMFDAAEDALYAQLDNRNFVFRKNSLSQAESHPVSFISSTADGLYATAAPDATSIWRAHRIDGRTFKFENEATGRWFGSLPAWRQEIQVPVALSEADAVEYQLDYIPAGTQATEEQLKGGIVLVNTRFANAASDADKYALHHGSAQPGAIVSWFANANTASFRKSSWHATMLSDGAARAMAAGFLTGDTVGRYSVSGEPVRIATLTHDNAAAELARYEDNTAVYTLNLPQAGSYVTVNGVKYFLTQSATLCNYESGRYLTANGSSLADSQGEPGTDNAAEVTFAEGRIAHYDITADGAAITDAVLGHTDALSVSAPEFTSFIAPVAVSFSTTATEIYVATRTTDRITIGAAAPGTVYAAGTGFIIKSEGQPVEFAIAGNDQDAVSDFTGTFTGTHEAYIFHETAGTVCYAVMPQSEAGTVALLDDSNTVSLTRLKEGDVIAPNTALLSLPYQEDGEFPEKWDVALNGDTQTTGIADIEAGRDAAARIFDLNGRQIENIRQAGIYVIGGKKIMVK